MVKSGKFTNKVTVDPLLRKLRMMGQTATLHLSRLTPTPSNRCLSVISCYNQEGQPILRQSEPVTADLDCMSSGDMGRSLPPRIPLGCTARQLRHPVAVPAYLANTENMTRPLA